MSSQTQTQPTFSDINFDASALNEALYKDNLDWTFTKPTNGAKYTIVYIIEQEPKQVAFQCPVCMEKCPIKDRQNMSCSHDLCTTCYKNMDKSGCTLVCPVCREAIPAPPEDETIMDFKLIIKLINKEIQDLRRIQVYTNENRVRHINVIMAEYRATFDKQIFNVLMHGSKNQVSRLRILLTQHIDGIKLMMQDADDMLAKFKLDLRGGAPVSRIIDEYNIMWEDGKNAFFVAEGRMMDTYRSKREFLELQEEHPEVVHEEEAEVQQQEDDAQDLPLPSLCENCGSVADTFHTCEVVPFVGSQPEPTHGYEFIDDSDDSESVNPYYIQEEQVIGPLPIELTCLRCQERPHLEHDELCFECAEERPTPTVQAPKRRIKCGICKQEGHNRRTCIIWCEICKKSGHNKSQCMTILAERVRQRTDSLA